MNCNFILQKGSACTQHVWQPKFKRRSNYCEEHWRYCYVSVGTSSEVLISAYATSIPWDENWHGQHLFS